MPVCYSDIGESIGFGMGLAKNCIPIYEYNFYLTGLLSFLDYRR